MIKRLVFFDCKWRSVPIVLALMLVMMAVLLVIGCMNQYNSENRTENMISNNYSVLNLALQEQTLQKKSQVLTSEGYWIKIDPIGSAYKNDITVSGTTNLPEGEMLVIHVSTTLQRSMPYGYDYSHESSADETAVTWINTTSRGFSHVIDVSKLNPGKYAPRVQSQRNLSIYSNGLEFDLLPAQSPVNMNHVDYIYNKCTSLPPLYVNGSMKPILISGGAALVPSDSVTQSNQIPYGAIILFSEDGIDRIFNENGTQVAAWYDSNELHLWQIPGGIKVQESGNITTIYLNEKRILTKINETNPCE